MRVLYGAIWNVYNVHGVLFGGASHITLHNIQYWGVGVGTLYSRSLHMRKIESNTSEEPPSFGIQSNLFNQEIGQHQQNEHTSVSQITNHLCELWRPKRKSKLESLFSLQKKHCYPITITLSSNNTGTITQVSLTQLKMSSQLAAGMGMGAPQPPAPLTMGMPDPNTIAKQKV